MLLSLFVINSGRADPTLSYFLGFCPTFVLLFGFCPTYPTFWDFSYFCPTFVLPFGFFFLLFLRFGIFPPLVAFL